MQVNIRSSYDSFRELRESNAYYVDKTEIIEEYLIRRFDKAVMFTRPRRFGKTLTMTMFRDFLDIRQDSKDIFAGLKVMEHPDVVDNYMNQYPVVFISLKEVFGQSYEEVFRNLCIAVSGVLEKNVFLLESEKVSPAAKHFFETILNRNAEKPDTEQSLDLLCRMLRQHYGKQVFVIIDEYDVPMAKALGTPYYDKVRDMIEHMLSYVCKTNDNVKAVMLSGCLYTVKNSTYTGVNNIIPYTVLSPIYASAIGFTDENVKKLLSDAGLMDHYDTVAEWYDGYMFGRDKMYCPWDVMSYVKSVLDGSYDEDRGPESYWLNTSATSLNLIHGFLGKTAGANEGFERLLAGETIDCTVNEYVPYHMIHESGDNLWSALVETGYLTKKVKGRPPLMPLSIPNRSIQFVFRQEVWNYFKDKVDNAYVRDLANALWSEETEAACSALNQILEATLSFYHEYHEYSYHLILDGFFTGLGYRVLSEQETGYGRSDLIILDPARNRCMILELKHVKTEAEMEAALQEAAGQIIQKKYESRLRYEGYVTRLQYGMAFYDKQARIVKI
ncbi:MAG: ATP-binding protein [Lachnospiraceae bacterium]|nr:ATP-binding protein [Lachnospiraceae bacterium]